MYAACIILNSSLITQDWCRLIYRGADETLALPGTKQATATKLLQATQKNKK